MTPPRILAQLQSKFAAGLLDREATASDELRVSALVFGIHARNTRVSLRTALENIFPVTQRLVGSDCFSAMADHFVAAHPPAHGWLSVYGAEFPNFLARCQQVADLGYLPDLARLEWARVHAANAPDDPGLDLKALTCVSPELLESCLISLHVAATLLCSPFPVFEIWQAHQLADDETLKQINLAKGTQNILVSRPATLEVDVYLLGPGDFAFLTALAGHSQLGAAHQAAIRVETEYNLGTRLGELVYMRALAANHSQ
jgi:hypothetical protein